jgi:hypothetical protein
MHSGINHCYFSAIYIIFVFASYGHLTIWVPWSIYSLSKAQILLRANKFRSTVHKAASTAVEIENKSAIAKCAPVLPFRVGHGFDLHRLEPGLPLIIGGIKYSS